MIALSDADDGHACSFMNTRTSNDEAGFQAGQCQGQHSQQALLQQRCCLAWPPHQQQLQHLGKPHTTHGHDV